MVIAFNALGTVLAVLPPQTRKRFYRGFST